MTRGKSPPGARESSTGRPLNPLAADPSDVRGAGRLQRALIDAVAALDFGAHAFKRSVNRLVDLQRPAPSRRPSAVCVRPHQSASGRAERYTGMPIVGHHAEHDHADRVDPAALAQRSYPSEWQQRVNGCPVSSWPTSGQRRRIPHSRGRAGTQALRQSDQVRTLRADLTRRVRPQIAVWRTHRGTRLASTPEPIPIAAPAATSLG